MEYSAYSAHGILVSIHIDHSPGRRYVWHLRVRGDVLHVRLSGFAHTRRGALRQAEQRADLAVRQLKNSDDRQKENQ